MPALLRSKGNTLRGSDNNLVGILVSGGAIVDAGYDSTVDSTPSHANFTGLGASTGNNDLTGYSGTGGSYAIDDENTTGQPDVLAEHNNFGPYVNVAFVEHYVFDINDNPTHTTVFIGGALNQQPAPAVVYVDDNWANSPLGVDKDGAGPGTAFGVDEFGTIQEAINAVQTGGQVIVHAGLYAENLTIPKKVKLTGDGQAAVTVVPAFSSVMPAAAGSLPAGQATSS